MTTSEENGKNRLYRNNGDFTFAEVGEAAGVANGNDENNAGAMRCGSITTTTGDLICWSYGLAIASYLRIWATGHSRMSPLRPGWASSTSTALWPLPSITTGTGTWTFCWAIISSQ